MFKNIRRTDRQISESEAFAILEKGEYGVLSMIDINGYAYGVPLNYTFLDNTIYFHSANEGSKLDNITKNSKVSFCVVGDTEVLPSKFSTNYESVICFGRAEKAFGEEKEKVLFTLINKYSKGFLIEGKEYISKAADKTTIIKVSIDNMTGKARR